MMHFQSGNVCDFFSVPFVVSVSELIERWKAISIRICQTDFWDRWSDRRFTFHCLQMCKYGFVSIVPLIVIRSQFWILETAASFCQIEVPSHRFLIIIGALGANITHKDKLALALCQSLWRKWDGHWAKVDPSGKSVYAWSYKCWYCCGRLKKSAVNWLKIPIISSYDV